MDLKEFNLIWTSKFKKIPIVSWEIKNQPEYSERYIRIHNLPNAKRYPTNKTEVNEILHRQNTIISDLVGINNSYYLVISNFNENDLLAEVSKYTSVDQFNLMPKLNLKEELPDFYDDDDEVYLQYAVTERKWQRNSLDQILVAVSKNILTNLLIIDKDNPILIAPYGGGIDLILKNKEQKDEFALNYKKWVA